MDLIKKQQMFFADLHKKFVNYNKITKLRYELIVKIYTHLLFKDNENMGLLIDNVELLIDDVEYCISNYIEKPDE